MENRSALIVLALREAGLRSMLSAQLTSIGVDLITANDPHDPALGRSMRRPAAALILDDAMVGARSAEWLTSLLDDPNWRTVVVLAAEPGAATAEPGDPRLIRLARANAVTALATLAAQWIAEGETP